MQQMIDKVKQKVNSGELFRVIFTSIPVEYEMNQLKSNNIEETEGLALRVIQDDKIGFSSSTSKNQIDGMIDKALEVAQFGQVAMFDFPDKITNDNKQEIELYDESVQDKSVSDMIKTGNEIIKRTLAINADLRCDAEISKQEGLIQYANTKGASFSYKKTSFSHSVMLQDTKENDMMMLMDSLQWGKDGLSLEPLWERLERNIKWSEKIVNIESDSMPVIFTPKALLVLLLPFISGLNGRIVNKKISPLLDKKDQLICNPLFSMYSDGTIDYANGSAPYDDEGIAMQRFPFIEKGILKNYYYDLQNAAEAGVKPTGNGIRHGFHSSPSPGVSNLIIPEGETSFDEMIKDIKEGIIVDQVLGLGQGNVLSGAFSNNVQLGFKIKDGKVVGRIKNVMIAGNAFEVLKDIAAIGDEARWVSGQYYFPHIYVKSLSVSTKQ
jgi:PmbA protein